MRDNVLASPASGPLPSDSALAASSDLTFACGDLRKCLAHNTPINRCAPCFPGFLRWLGKLCYDALLFHPVAFEPLHPIAIHNSTLRGGMSRFAHVERIPSGTTATSGEANP